MWKLCHLIVVQGAVVSCSELNVDWFRLHVKILMPMSDWIKWRNDVVSSCYAQPVSNLSLCHFSPWKNVESATDLTKRAAQLFFFSQGKPSVPDYSDLKRPKCSFNSVWKKWLHKFTASACFLNYNVSSALFVMMWSYTPTLTQNSVWLTQYEAIFLLKSFEDKIKWSHVCQQPNTFNDKMIPRLGRASAS